MTKSRRFLATFVAMILVLSMIGAITASATVMTIDYVDKVGPYTVPFGTESQDIGLPSELYCYDEMFELIILYEGQDFVWDDFGYDSTMSGEYIISPTLINHSYAWGSIITDEDLFVHVTVLD